MRASRRLNSYRAGIMAELVAAGYLSMKGYRLLGWRKKTPVGEIDIVARKGGTLVFVEVKNRRSTDAGLEAVSARAKERIARAALYLLAGRPEWQGRAMRFDVVALSWPFFIRHIDNAWRPQA